MHVPDPPNLDGWLASCETCALARELKLMKEWDHGTDEVYYDYVCSECFSIVLNIHRANPSERERRSPGNSVN